MTRIVLPGEWDDLCAKYGMDPNRVREVMFTDKVVTFRVYELPECDDSLTPADYLRTTLYDFPVIA